MVELYTTMYDYAQGANISHYRHSTAEEEPEIVKVVDFMPANDIDLRIETDTDKAIEHNGNIYLPIWWGEEESSAILASAVNELCYIRYIYDPDTHEYISDGQIYETENEAAGAA